MVHNLITSNKSHLDFDCSNGIGKNSLVIQNITTELLIFKFQTTNVKGYAIKPATGILCPQQSLTVEILSNSRSANDGTVMARDKILIQASPITEGQSQIEDLKQIWNQTDQANIQKIKITSTCIFRNTYQVAPTTPKPINLQPIINQPQDDYINNNNRSNVQNSKTGVKLFFFAAAFIVVWKMYTGYFFLTKIFMEFISYIFSTVCVIIIAIFTNPDSKGFNDYVHKLVKQDNKIAGLLISGLRLFKEKVFPVQNFYVFSLGYIRPGFKYPSFIGIFGHWFQIEYLFVKLNKQPTENK